MNKNRVKAILLSVLVSLFALGGFFAPPASAVTDPGGIQQYLELPLNFVRPAPTFKDGSGTGCLTPCKDVASGIGVYADVSSSHTIETANFSSVTAIDVTNGVPAPNDTSSVLTPNWAVVGGTLHVYNLTIGHKYKLYFIFDDAQSSDIQKFVSLTKSYCESTQISQTSNVPPSDQNAFNIVYHLQDGCARYNSTPFLPAAINPYIINGNQPILYKTAVTTLPPESLQAPTPSNPSVVNANASSSQPSDDCPLTSDSALRWLGCPLIAIGASTVQTLQNLIQGMLYTPVNQIFDDAGFRASADSFRVLGMALIIIAGLAMVISQAAGLEIFDAYTIRKVLPRLVVALAGMALAWPILRFTVTLFDDLGLWASSLIGAIPHVAAPHHTNNTAGTALEAAFAAVGGLAVVALLGFGGILSLLGTVILALLVGFVVLAVRQMVILLAVILAPLAIAAYVLPGTQKLWHFWRESFITTLVMFPIIMAFLASGKALSTLLSASSNESLQILAIFVYFAPFLLLPFAFKLAGGLMSTIFAMAHDRGRGGFDRLKKYRQGKSAENIHAMKQGNRFRGNSLPARGFNATTRNVANVSNAGIIPWKMRSRMQAASASTGAATLAEYMDKDVAFAAIRGNDDYLQATMKSMGGGDNEADWRRYLSGMGYEGRSLEQGVAAIRAAKRNVSNDVFSRAAVMANASTGTGWKEGGVTQMMQSINDVAGDDRHTAATMLAQMRSMAGQAGRLDLAGSGFGVQAKQLDRMYQEQKDTGRVSDLTMADVKHQIHANLLDTKGAGEFARARGQAVGQIAPEMLYDLRQAHAKVDATAAGSPQRAAAERELAQKYANMANFHDSLNHMAPENAKFIADNVLSQQIYAGDNTTVMDRINEYRRTNNTDFLHTRKDYDARQYREEGGPPPPPDEH